MTEIISKTTVEHRLTCFRAEVHPFCFACSEANPMGLAMRYHAEVDGSVSGTFLGHAAIEGYPGMLHGGIIATLLDGAMANCLFAQGLPGMAAELRLRYHAPVAAAEPMTLRAWREESAHNLHEMRAELTQAGVVKIRAEGKFMESNE
jgi:acyl-coenzyme A thioesterase PaaI-like protein